jgi:hypothetical protein
MLTEETRRLNDAQVPDAIAALRRAERDLEERLARHVSALRENDRFHSNEPLYQALYFALERLCRRRRRMEEELAMREASVRADRSLALTDNLDRVLA